jgi:hypothetical protein
MFKRSKYRKNHLDNKHYPNILSTIYSKFVKKYGFYQYKDSLKVIFSKIELYKTVILSL